MNKFYITAAIPYVNAKPHIGWALEATQADVLARFHRLIGDETRYLSGADENALKNVQAAEKAGKQLREFIDEHNAEFQDLVKKLNVSIDIWQRGSDEEHHYVGSQKLWKLCEKDIYKKKYRGLYCVGCEQFYEPEELNEKGECFEHPGKKLDEVEEENYFFRLSSYKEKLLDLITTDKLKVYPDFRKNEVLGWLKGNVPDLSISRSNERAKNWGVPVPGDNSQRIYVWFDALNIYQTGVGFGWDEKLYKKWWPADLHVIGKGITRFHTVYWPAFLLSAGLELPKNILIHGYYTVNGQKISKTLGNVIDPVELIDKYGVDPVRYYFLAKTPLFEDGDYSEEKFKEAYNSDLANGLGNTVARIAKLAEGIGLEFKSDINPKDVYSPEQKSALHQFRIDVVVNNIWKVELDAINKHIDQNQPWLIKDPQKLKVVLLEEINDLVNFASKISPFLPEASEKILKQFNGKIKAGSPLFPRIS